MNNFEMIAKIGEGQFGDVYMALHTSGVLYALKAVKADFLQTWDVKRLTDDNILSKKLFRLGHQNVIAYYGEIAVSLLGYAKNFEISDVKTMAHSLLSGLEALHSDQIRIIHRDLNPSNILFTGEGVLKIAGFGKASMKRYAAIEPGSLHYRAPELIFGLKRHSRKMDIWSAGCIIGEIITRQVFFDGENEEDQILKIDHHFGPISAKNVTVKNWPKFKNFKKLLADNRRPCTEDIMGRSLINNATNDTDGKRLVSELLDVNPTSRLTAQLALQHFWFNGDIKPNVRNIVSQLKTMETRYSTFDENWDGSDVEDTEI